MSGIVEQTNVGGGAAFDFQETTMLGQDHIVKVAHAKQT
jgi:hypothetical protein